MKCIFSFYITLTQKTPHIICYNDLPRNEMCYYILLYYTDNGLKICSCFVPCEAEPCTEFAVCSDKTKCFQGVGSGQSNYGQ